MVDECIGMNPPDAQRAALPGFSVGADGFCGASVLARRRIGQAREIRLDIPLSHNVHAFVHRRERLRVYRRSAACHDDASVIVRAQRTTHRFAGFLLSFPCDGACVHDDDVGFLL